MSMNGEQYNREQKRMLKKQGALNDDGTIVNKRERRQPPPKAQTRTSPGQFLKEVNLEMRKVSWPTRAETINYSIIVFVTLVLMTLFILGLDFGFTKVVNEIFNR